MSATSGAPGTSSAAEINRPETGATPKVSNNRPLTLAAVTRTGCLFPPRLVPPVCQASSEAQECVSRRKSKNSGAEVQNRGKPQLGNVGNSVYTRTNCSGCE